MSQGRLSVNAVVNEARWGTSSLYGAALVRAVAVEGTGAATVLRDSERPARWWSYTRTLRRVVMSAEERFTSMAVSRVALVVAVLTHSPCFQPFFQDGA